MQTKVKICCIQNIDEANLAIQYGASAIGLVSEMPSGPGPIFEAKIREIAEAVPKSINTFLLTSKTDSREIINQLKRCGTDTVQIVDSLTSGNYEDIRNAIDDISIVQVIHVINDHSLKQAIETAPYVDALLLDSGNPSLATKVLGGTGKTHNWQISNSICRNVDIPVYLAGGLNQHNISAAIKTVRPFGVDVCTGVRSDRILDKDKLSEYMRQIKNSDLHD